MLSWAVTVLILAVVGALLVSWSGSMFEYLMPSLVMHAPNGSLLEDTSRQVARCQIGFGGAHDVPWGVSESAYNVRDVEYTYQYSNFGVPGLGLKRGLDAEWVIAPYATALAAMVDVAEGVPTTRSVRDQARRHGVEAIDARQHQDVPAVIRDMTDGRGSDSVIDAVGMEAHGAPVGELAQKATGLLPKKLAAAVTERFAVDRLEALVNCIDTVRRGGTLSISGVYGGQLDPLPMMQLFDKGIQIRMGQAHVKRWIDEIMPLLTGDGDPLGTEDLATHKLPLEQAPQAYEMFQQKKDGAIKIVLKP